MLHIVSQDNRDREYIALRSMFAARKRVFIDLLKWELPALAGKYEVDHFDDPHATYLIVTDPACKHLASARLLPTTRPALLDSLFPHLVAGAIPRGKGITEITRFCLSPGIGARERRVARNMLLVSLVEHAHANGIHSYTGVAEVAWFQQIRTFGWDCRQLGEPCGDGARQLVALQINIDETTISKLAAAGISPQPNVISAQAA